MAISHKQHQLMGACLGGVIAILSFLFAFLFATNMRDYGAIRLFIAAVIASTGAGIGTAIWLRTKSKRLSARVILAAHVLFLFLTLAAIVSMFVPGRVTYARFGLTVYGIIPVPGFDIQVSGAGVLSLRDKSHVISEREVRALARPGVEAIVIGIGWDSVVRVDPTVAEIEGVEIHQMPTPEAIALFNLLKSEGRRVALLAHSTC